MDIRTVSRLIECRRTELNTLANIYGIGDQRVLEKSVQLDHIMNVYIRKKGSQQGMKQRFNIDHNRIINTSTQHA
ncbi:Spo0E family sporulation regulatory protein-aspartic acid phosphatase [Paenibacillus sp. FA6]|uniref:Spo0E family sporulation regulatory protein-aspartic acid phosphatase n=1 Tax=Paenibacillus sp. FA6 TaxID=3413029 RepID=UPI003F658203